MNTFIEKNSYHLQKMNILANDIHLLKKFYLDLRYWISIRDSIDNNETESIYFHIYTKLKSLVLEGKAICPISEVVFLEILKQSGTDKYIKTIKLVEELSKNVIIISEREMIYLEFVKLFRESFHLDISVHLPIWSKVIDIIGFSIPENNLGLSVKDEVELFKSYYDYAWNLSLTKIIETNRFGIKRIESLVFDIDQLSNNNKEHEKEITNFKELLDNERKGCLDAYKEIAWKAFNAVIDQNELSITDDKNELFHTILFDKIVNGNNIIGAIEIPARIHSLIRYEKRKYKESNDIYDFHHAQISIPYFDFFLTEEKLFNILMHSRVKITDFFKCKILHNNDEVLKEIEKIA